MTQNSASRQRKHLRRLSRIFVECPLFLITICALGREKVLTSGSLPEAVTETLQDAAAASGWQVGRYVIMPDHLHFFAAPGAEACTLSAFVGRFKGISTRRAWQLGRAGRLWQREFFDHLMRSGESYAQKWEYVRRNPVRAGLCQRPEDWPYQGEVEPLAFL